MVHHATRCGEAWGNVRWVGGDGKKGGRAEVPERRGGETSLTCAHFVGLLSPRRPDATRRSSGVSRIEFARPSSVRLSFSIIAVIVVVAVFVLISARDRVVRGQLSVREIRWLRRERERAHDVDDVECAPNIFHRSVLSNREREREKANCHNIRTLIYSHQPAVLSLTGAVPLYGTWLTCRRERATVSAILGSAGITGKILLKRRTISRG